MNNGMKEYEFIQANNNIIMERIKLVSYMLIFTYPLFLIVDFLLFKGVDNPIFHRNLIVIHLLGPLGSLIFLILYSFKEIKNQGLLIYFYVAFYVFLGVVSSLNSQLLTGNIMVYIIIVIGVATIFPMKPINLSLLVLIFHLLFISVLPFLDSDHFSVLTKQINSTGTVVISCLIGYAFYTYRKRDFINQSKLKGNEESFRSLFNINPSPLILLNLENSKIELINKQAIEYYQLQDYDISDLDGSFIFNQNEKNGILNRLHAKQNIKNYVMQKQISTELTWSILKFELVDYFEKPCVLIGITDITDLKQVEEELIKYATTDMLTGVMNRRVGMDLLERKLSTPEEFILCFMDINHLKHVNDQIGHKAGDELIKTVCKVIKATMDSDDILFRLGGDEFVVIFHNKTVEEVDQIWCTIQKKLESINYAPQMPYPISVSHGLYHYRSENTVTVEEMMEIADQEMYKEKFGYKANTLFDGEIVQSGI
jgi:diguanylate cyclase (GGDEF)-like protein